jgi:hypothetical protein
MAAALDFRGRHTTNIANKATSVKYRIRISSGAGRTGGMMEIVYASRAAAQLT